MLCDVTAGEATETHALSRGVRELLTEIERHMGDVAAGFDQPR